MFRLLREKHQEWSSKLQEKIDLMKSQDPNNPLIRELEEQHRIANMNIVELGRDYNTKTAIDKIGTEMQKSAGGAAIEDIHNEFLSIVNVSCTSVSYLMFDTFWKNFNLNDRVQILHAIIDNGHVQNVMDHQDPVSGLRAAELILPTASYFQSKIIHRNIFSFLLQRSTMLDVVDKNGDTALSIMVRQNIPSNVKKLLEKGASVFAPTKDLLVELLGHFYKQTSILDAFDVPTDTSGLWHVGGAIYYDINNPVIVNVIDSLRDKIHSDAREDGYFASSDNAIKIIKLISEHGSDINKCINTQFGDKTVFQCIMRPM